MIEIASVRHAYPEKAGFFIDRKAGLLQYTFLHFFGSVEMEYRGRIIQTAPHAVIIYNTHTPQYFKSHTLLTHDWFHFTGDLAPLLFENGLEPDRIYYPVPSDFITRHVMEIESEFYSMRKNQKRMAQLKAEELFVLLGRAASHEMEPAIGQRTIEKFRYLRGKMFISLGENWNIPRMAEEVNFSPSRFHAIYKEIFGTAPMTDLIKARINSAENMLLFENRSISEISLSLGYQNTTHFIRQFKAVTGFSPAQYRKTHRSG